MGPVLVICQVEILGVRPDATPVELPPVRARPGGYRFLPDGTGLVYLPFIPSLDFSLVDFATKTQRQLTRLSDRGAQATFSRRHVKSPALARQGRLRGWPMPEEPRASVAKRPMAPCSTSASQ